LRGYGAGKISTRGSFVYSKDALFIKPMSVVYSKGTLVIKAKEQRLREASPLLLRTTPFVARSSSISLIFLLLRM